MISAVYICQCLCSPIVKMNAELLCGEKHCSHDMVSMVFQGQPSSMAIWYKCTFVNLHDIKPQFQLNCINRYTHMSWWRRWFLAGAALPLGIRLFFLLITFITHNPYTQLHRSVTMRMMLLAGVALPLGITFCFLSANNLYKTLLVQTSE